MPFSDLSDSRADWVSTLFRTRYCSHLCAVRTAPWRPPSEVQYWAVRTYPAQRTFLRSVSPSALEGVGPDGLDFMI